MSSLMKSLSGAWFLTMRKDRGLSLQEIEDMTGLTSSQVSRIENGRSELSLFAAVKICYALDVSLFDISRAHQWHKSDFDILSRRGASEKIEGVPIASDIKLILRAYRENPMEAKDFLRKSFNWVRYAIGVETKLENTRGNQIIKDAIEPLQDKYQSVTYPPNLTQEMILEVYLNQGVLSIFDLGLFLRQKRKKKNMSLQNLAGEAGLSYSGLRRIEVGEIERIKFSDILVIDTALGNEGDLLAIAWDVAQLYTGVSLVDKKFAPLAQWTVREKSLAETLIVISRWYKAHYLEKNWLKELRKNM